MSGADGSPRLLVPDEVWAEMVEHLEAAYPDEGCGVMLGREEDGAWAVREAVRAPNEWGGRDDRYAVDPDLLRDLMVREEEGGPAVLGFYHSHPDAAPVPSATDRELGWPWYHYLIVPVAGGRAGRPRLWRFGGRREAPREGRVERTAGPAGRDRSGVGPARGTGRGRDGSSEEGEPQEDGRHE